MAQLVFDKGVLLVAYIFRCIEYIKPEKCNYIKEVRCLKKAFLDNVEGKIVIALLKSKKKNWQA